MGVILLNCHTVSGNRSNAREHTDRLVLGSATHPILKDLLVKQG